MADTPVRIAYRSYLIHHRDHFPLAVVVGFFEHHILNLHKPCLGTALIFIQLHGDVADILLGLGNHHMLQGIYTAAGLFNLRCHELAGLCSDKKSSAVRASLK